MFDSIENLRSCEAKASASLSRQLRAEAQLILHLVEHTTDCHMIGSAFVQVESF